MHRFILAAAFALAACSSTGGGEGGGLSPLAPNIISAGADSRRPDEDRARDASRHPAETLAFARIRQGARVGEFFSGGGYFTRLLAVAVGERGRVYAVVRPEGQVSTFERTIIEVATQYPNMQVVRTSYTDLNFPERLDVIFTAQNYHDFAIADYGFGDRNAVNRAAFSALKPGGLYVVIDHSAIAGSPVQTAGQGAIHRIDEATVRREVEAAGFVFDGSSDVLRNPADPRTASVFDPAIRGHTDQFMLRFRKPHRLSATGETQYGDRANVQEQSSTSGIR